MSGRAERNKLWVYLNASPANRSFFKGKKSLFFPLIPLVTQNFSVREENARNSTMGIYAWWNYIALGVFFFIVLCIFLIIHIEYILTIITEKNR